MSCRARCAWRGCEHGRRTGRTVVFTNGVFDLLHAGHVRYLSAARAEGDHLVVAVNTDDTVRAAKGPDRPVHPAAERAELVAALRVVDLAVIFDEPTPADIIAALQPDVLVKGADWPLDQIVGARDRVGARRQRRTRADRTGSFHDWPHRQDPPVGRLSEPGREYAVPTSGRSLLQPRVPGPSAFSPHRRRCDVDADRAAALVQGIGPCSYGSTPSKSSLRHHRTPRRPTWPRLRTT